MFETILGVLLIIMSLFLIVAVLMQHGKSHGLSGTIAGGAETLFGKNKGSDIDSKLSKITTVVSIIFVVVVIIAYIAQGDNGNVIQGDGTINYVTTAPADGTTAATGDTTAAE